MSRHCMYKMINIDDLKIDFTDLQVVFRFRVHLFSYDLCKKGHTRRMI